MATLVRITLENGLDRFHCPVCAHPIVTSGEGEAEDVCPHVLFVRNFVGEFGHVAEAYADLVDGDDQPELAELCSALPATAVVFSFAERPRGGGHEPADFAVCIDFRAAAVGDEADR